MTPVYSGPTTFIVFHKRATSNFIDTVSSFYPVKWQKSIAIVEVASGELLNVLRAIRGFEYLKVMDRFFLFADAEYSEELYALFFDHIASNYEKYINVEQNKDLIRRYFELINLNVNEGTEPAVLDFGSGSGLATQVRASDDAFSPFVLSGFEISSEMEKLSAVAGLKMYNKKTFGRLADHTFDAIIGSYSFHFVTSEKVYQELWRKLKTGGLIIGNFHKNIGLQVALDFFTKNNAAITELGDHANGKIFSFRKSGAPLLTLPEAVEILTGECRVAVNIDDLPDFLFRYSLIPTFGLNGATVCLENDVRRIMPFISNIKSAEWVYGGIDLYEQVYVVESPSLRIEFSRNNTLSNENFNPALIVSLFTSDDGTADSSAVNFPVGNSLRLTLRAEKLKQIYDQAFHDKNRIDAARATIFANSASYMGSKKTLRPFLFTAIKMKIPSTHLALDLMCGSGAVAGMLALNYETYVSDAMNFSKVLAIVQGHGYSVDRARSVFEQLKIYFKENLRALRAAYEPELDQEDAAFHSRIGKELKEKYAAFCRKYSYTDRDYYQRYKKKQSDPVFPFELFTIAYGNTFFGLYQSMQLDSLRYAIDHLADENDKTWALGALIATASGIGNTYAGHFAQPKFKDVSILKDNEFIRLVEQRSLSVLSEFEARFMAFAQESESEPLSEINALDGPWQSALTSFRKLPSGKKRFVYVDAPYTRDEYSRYYHVLETLIDYRYHNLTGLGRIPDKKLGHRFRSAFFTRNVSKLRKQFVEIFTTILNSGDICGWSYSNSAAAECAQVIYELVNTTNCKVESFESPYQYKAQGGSGQKNIKEYLIFFYPEKSND